MNGHRQLHVWRTASDLTTLTYRLTGKLPSGESLVTVPQLRRAAWSVQNNIAEGNAKRGRAERRRFFDVALGSLAEVDSMAGTLPRIFPLDAKILEEVEVARREITAGLIRMLRNGRP